MGFITLDDAKRQLRVAGDQDDEHIDALIAAAAAHIEEVNGFVAPARAAVPFVFHGFSRELRLPRRPIDLETITITYLDPNGDEQEFTQFRAYELNGFLRLAPAIGHSWPATACAAASVIVTADVGFAAEADAPETLRHASRLCVTTWFDDREAPLPDAVAELLEAERPRRL